MIIRPVEGQLAGTAFVSIPAVLLQHMAFTLEPLLKLKICTYPALVKTDSLKGKQK
jgi:hypothetical protein